MNLDDHQPSHDPEVDDDHHETLSLRDLPLSTSSSCNSSNTDVTCDESNLHHHQQDTFEFFSGDFNPSSSDNIIFYGKIIPYRGPKPAEDDHKKKATKSEPRSDLYPNHGQLNRFWSLPLSAKSSEFEVKRVSSRKSRWYLLAFGVGKVPVKMELDDMKFRQSRKMSSSYNYSSSSSQKFETSRNRSSRGLLGILGCSRREDANSMVKPSLVCIPSL